MYIQNGVSQSFQLFWLCLSQQHVQPAPFHRVVFNQTELGRHQYSTTKRKINVPPPTTKDLAPHQQQVVLRRHQQH
jgi:hypothetical protein